MKNFRSGFIYQDQTNKNLLQGITRKGALLWPLRKESLNGDRKTLSLK